MERLYKGIQKFQQTHFKKEEDYFKHLSKGQSPDVLFFTCSDSRVDPNLITQSKPGELFIVKNVGNIVPPCLPMRKKTCTAAAIEFAILKLKITDIVVCGHSDCAALKALYLDEKDFDEMPNLKDWVETASNVRELVLRNNHDPSYKARIEMTEKEYIIQQLDNLRTYPLITEALKEERLTLHGWYYEIGTGTIYAYNNKSRAFDRIHCKEQDLEIKCCADPCEDLR